MYWRGLLRAGRHAPPRQGARAWRGPTPSSSSSPPVFPPLGACFFLFFCGPRAGRGAGAPRGRALRDPPRHRRPGRDARARPRLPARRRPPADRGRPRSREDADDQDDGERPRRTFHRVQFTPDLVPSDLVGTRIYRPTRAIFDTELGPVFCNFLLADEINRAPAKVQSALLEVMQEHQVTIGETTYPVPDPFLVWRRRTRSSPRAPTRCPRRRSTASCSRSSSTTPARDEELTIVQRQLVPPPELRQALSLDDLLACSSARSRRLRRPGDRRLLRRPGDRDPRPAEHGLAEMAAYVAFGASPARPISLVQSARASRCSAAATTCSRRISRRSRGRAPAPARAELPGARRGGQPGPDPRRGARRGPAAARSTSGGGEARWLNPLDALRCRATTRPPGPGPLPDTVLRALDLTIGRRVEGLLAGDYRSALRRRHRARAGAAVRARRRRPPDRLERHRRTRVPHVRVQLAERVMTTWLVLDTSASMASGRPTGARRTWPRASRSRSGTSRRGAATGSGSSRSATPIRGRCRRARDGVGLLGLLTRAPRRARRPPGATSFAEAFRGPRRGAPARARRGRVRLPRPADWRRPLLQLAGAHDVLAVEIRDPREQELPNVGELWLVDPETGRQLRVDTRSARLRERFAPRRPPSERSARRRFASLGVRHVVLSTSGDWLRRSSVPAAGRNADDLRVAARAARAPRSCRSPASATSSFDRRAARHDAARFATPALFPNVVARPGRLRHLPRRAAARRARRAARRGRAAARDDLGSARGGDGGARRSTSRGR